MSLSEATRSEVARLKDLYPSARSAVLPSLWAVQHECGYLPPEGMREVAEMLDLAPSEIQAVATFYSMYFDKPQGTHHVLACINVSCALRGADAIVNHLEQRLGCPSGSTTHDGIFTWESTVECLGACGGAPAMQIDHHFHENLTEESVDKILTAVAAGIASTTEEPSHLPADAPPAATPAEAASKTPTTKPRTRRARVQADDL